jgi:DNA polymerase-3 subunit epsilon
MKVFSRAISDLLSLESKRSMLQSSNTQLVNASAGSSAGCRERLVRLIYNAGDKAGAEELLRQMIDDPGTDEEFTFASDFYARKFGGRRTSACTELLRSGSTITVDDTHRGNPEAGVAGVIRVFFAENVLWQTLFGLLFWDELFESGQLHSGFDWVPQCLKNRSFSRQFAGQIDAKLAAVKSGEALNLLLKTVAARWGQPNGVFAWDHVDIEALRLLLTGTSNDGLAAIVRAMCENFRAMRDGFPDLMLAKDGKISFIEVKAEGDVIRRNQLTRLRQLGNAGIPAEIGRVDYRFDPEQDYIVVDIETTGGWASSDRITEIGAVKIRNHHVVGEWHSLLNPQKSIPARIVQLTGITNDMVRGAPLFAEIADSFMEFMGDGIFVAHNVNFDYGFISREFERLERRFRFPKVCTCAGMRRRFPGYKSYSLGNLCIAFDIELKDHHRALADARAAAGLLNLMNALREEADFETVPSAAA